MDQITDIAHPTIAIIVDIDRTILDTAEIVSKMARSLIDLGLIGKVDDFNALYEKSRDGNGSPDYDYIVQELVIIKPEFNPENIKKVLESARFNFSGLLFEGSTNFLQRNHADLNIWQIAFSQGKTEEQLKKLTDNKIDQYFDEVVIKEFKINFCKQLLVDLVSRDIKAIFIADDNKEILQAFNDAYLELKASNETRILFENVRLKTVLVKHDTEVTEGECHSIKELGEELQNFTRNENNSIEGKLLAFRL